MDRQGLREVARAHARALVAALLLASPAAAGTLEFLYIEPNVGTASGGHVALRIDDAVHHYQHADGGLRAARSHPDWFRYLYSVLQNRTIHVARLEVSDDTRDALDHRFAARATIEHQHFATQRGLADDRALLEQALGEASGPSGLRLRGAGYFFGAGEPVSVRPEPASFRPEPAIAALRARVVAERGDGWLAERMADLDRQRRALDPADFPAPDPEPRADRLPAHRERLSERLAHLSLRRLALQVIAEARPLRPGSLARLPDAALVLGERERAALGRFGSRLEDEVLALLDSPRPDRGYPLLVGLARLAAVDASLRAGRWIVLDSFPADATVIPAASLEARRAFLGGLAAYAADELAAERRLWAQAERVDERRYQAVEDALNRSIELARGLREGRDIRVHGEALVPARAPDGRVAWRPALGRDALDRALDEARRREREHARALLELYRYQLFTRNCVTEIFAGVDETFPEEEQVARLGGVVQPDRGLHFWPRFAFRAVERSWRVSERGEIPSFRRTRLAQMKTREHPVRVHLREANTLTSTVYRRNPRDSFFLFFTRDSWPTRPAYGAANLLAGLGQTALGLARLPFDGGASLLAGAKGVAFSVPELAFVSLRKGTLEYARSSEPRTLYAPIAAGSR